MRVEVDRGVTAEVRVGRALVVAGRLVRDVGQALVSAGVLLVSGDRAWTARVVRMAKGGDA